MTDDRYGAQEKTAHEPQPWRAVLTPHRSLSPPGFVLFMSALGVVSFATGLAFAVMGAWPVLGFFGLDVLIVYIAFKLNYRAARQSETVEIASPDLVITRTDARGRSRSVSFNAYWARVQLSEQPSGRSILSVGSHGRRVRVGAFLSEDERRDFAAALSRALADRRHSAHLA
jgi:uncharacterized membrane protein